MHEAYCLPRLWQHVQLIDSSGLSKACDSVWPNTLCGQHSKDCHSLDNHGQCWHTLQARKGRGARDRPPATSLCRTAHNADRRSWQSCRCRSIKSACSMAALSNSRGNAEV